MTKGPKYVHYHAPFHFITIFKLLEALCRASTSSSLFPHQKITSPLMCLMPRSERSEVRISGPNPIWVIKVVGAMKVVMCVIEKWRIWV